MPRGKPFVCWLSSLGGYHDVALLIGDAVELLLDSGKWVRGKFGYRKKNGYFPYVVKCGKTEHQAALIHTLRPVLEPAERME